jgi:hypothetical protein
MVKPETSPTLIEASPFLQDPEERNRRILDVTERNSLIEGLPALTELTRSRILAQLQAMDSVGPGAEPAE